MLPGRVPLVFGRRYSTALDRTPGAGPPGMFGPGWASPFEMRVLRDLEGYRLVTEDGEGELVFEDPAGAVDRGEAVRVLGAFSELRREGDDLVVTRWDPDGRDVVRFVFPIGADGAWWPLASRQRLDGHGVDVERDRHGRPVVLRQRRERRGFRLAYDRAGRLTDVYVVPAQAGVGYGDGAPHTPDARPVLRYRYDAAGRLAGFADALGHTASYAYGEAGRMTREVNIGGMTYHFAYDADGRCVLTTGDGDYGRNELALDDVAQETRVTDSLGHTTTYVWNERGQVEKEVSPLGHVRQTVYDEHGRIVQAVRPSGATTSYTYDDRGDRVLVTLPDGATTAYAYDDRHRVVSVTGPLGNETRRAFDAAGRLVSVTNALGHTATYDYDRFGDLVRITNPKGHARAFEWSADGDLVAQTDYLGHRTRFAHDAEGHVIGVMDPEENRTLATLDALGRVREVHLPDGARRRYTWDAYDQLTAFVDERGVLTEIKYAYCGLVTELVRAHGGRVRFAWSTVPGQLLGVQNERGERHTFAYDADGRMTREVDFAGRVTAYAHDPDGQTERVKDNAGHVTTLDRDALGRVTDVLYDDGSQVAYAYDPRGFITSADNGQCVVERAYDALGRLVSETQDGVEVTSEYDAAGDRVRRRSSLGSDVAFEWDPNGQLARLATHGYRALEFAYDARMNEIGRGVEGGVRIQHAYDVRGRVVEQSVFGAGADSGHVAVGVEPVVHRQFRYDAAGNLTHLVDDRWGTTQYAYDQLSRIVSAEVAQGLSESFAYDLTDNLVEIGTGPTVRAAAAHPDGLGYGPGNTLAYRGSVRYEHDALGQRIRKTDAEGTTHYRWNRSGQLAEVEFPDGAVWRYRYDAFSRRVGKEGPSFSTAFVWDGDVVLHEVRDDDGPPSRVDWEFDPYGFDPIAKTDEGRQHLAVTSVNGAPSELVSGEGRVVWSLRPLAFGGAEDGDVGTECPVRLQGQWHDDETGLSYNRFRYYDPQSGRFVSKDPLSVEGGTNYFSYAPNTWSWFDPYGLADRPCSGLTYAPRIRERQVEDPRYHGFPYSFDDTIVSQGRRVDLDNGGTAFLMRGGINDLNGVFNLIIRDGVVTHRDFVREGGWAQRNRSFRFGVEYADVPTG